MQAILKEWQSGRWRPFYWLEGEESFFLDQLSAYAQNHIVPAMAKPFDEIILFGKDVSINSLHLACRQLPLQSPYRLVLLKEAQQLREVEKFCASFTPVSDKIIFIGVCKAKKIEGKTKIKAHIQKIGTYYFAKKLYESQLPAWIERYAKKHGSPITPKAMPLFMEAVGTELTRVANELDKIFLNIDKGAVIDEDLVSRFVGISKEYNFFELQNAIGRKDTQRVIKIRDYIMRNPKSMPLAMLITMLHTYFIKLLICMENKGKPQAVLVPLLGVPPFFLKDYVRASENYNPQQIRESVQVLFRSHLQSLGVNYVPSGGEAAIVGDCLMRLIFSLDLR